VLFRSFYLFEKNDFTNSKILGDISVSNILFGGLGSCQIGYKLDYTTTGFGYMFEALQRIINMLFCDLRLHRIEAYIMPENEKSIRLIELLGFKFEGTAEKYMLINDIWEDHLRYILINS
jgi:[ribosomal protein S5]-alanine N-acetyltransferase